MNRFEHVKNVSRKARVAQQNKHAAIKKDRRKKLNNLAKHADYEMFRSTDRRLKQNRKDR